MARPCMIVDSKYCARVAVELAVVRTTDRLTDGNFVIRDTEENLLFLPNSGLDNDNTMILLDASRSPVLTLRKKFSLHGRFEVFRGDSTEEDDLLYTVKRTHMVNLMTKVDVFLSHNKEQKICDFRIKGTCFKRSCVVYAGESDVIVAKLQKKPEDNFSVTVYPNIDSAFMASLVVILDHLIRQDRTHTFNNVQILLSLSGVPWPS